jgi:putative DNA primase/helicase
MANAAWQAIEAANTPPQVFLYAGALAWLVADATGLPTVELMSQDHVRHHLADVASFIRWTSPGRDRSPKKKPAFPPEVLAADLRAVPRATLPRLERVVRMPVFTQDGRLLSSPGYDGASGLYLAAPAGLTLPPIPSAPSGAEIASARQALCEDLLGDFPFVTDADLAHAVALLLTPLLRELVAGCVPLFVVSKPTPRTGAGLLTKVVSIVQGGAPIAATTISVVEEEMRKRLTALLLASPAMILLDNLHGRLDSAALAAILTSPTWEDRLLGRSQTVRLLVRAVFMATGNNVALSNEMAGRSVLIRLDPKIEDPSVRTGFRHLDLEAWVTLNRARLLWSALVFGQAWIAAGRPMASAVFGGFAEWAAVLGGVLKVAGITGFLENRRTLFDQADEESAHVRAFLADWWKEHHDAPVLVKALIELAKSHPLPIASRSDQGTLIRLGQLVKSLEDRRYNIGESVVVRRAGEFRRSVLWQLAACESDESCESFTAGRPSRACARYT